MNPPRATTQPKVVRVQTIAQSIAASGAGCQWGIDELPRLADHQPVSLKNNARLVYSTNTAGKCAICGWPQRDCRCSSRRAATEAIPARIVAKLRMEKKGRGGKTVTVVYGLPQNPEFLRELTQELKRACGTGGTAVDDGVELQGDLRERVREVLTKRGYVVKG
jgi:translation initiation factor 1